jgi:hypothetical protein
MSLLGLVRHLAEMERARGSCRRDRTCLGCSAPKTSVTVIPMARFPTEVIAEAWEAWGAEVDLATGFVAEAPSPDITGNDPLDQHGSGGVPISLREALIGMIGEYARHMVTPTCCASGSTDA